MTGDAPDAHAEERDLAADLAKVEALRRNLGNQLATYRTQPVFPSPIWAEPSARPAA